MTGFPGLEAEGCFQAPLVPSCQLPPGFVRLMPLADFVHLRTHSAYSLSAGAIKIRELVGLCRAEAMPAVAITDCGNLFGALEFATACAESGIQPIIGVEIALAPEATNRATNGAAGGAKNGNGAKSGNGNGNGLRLPNGAEPDRIVLLVQSEIGYRNLMGLTSRAYLDGEAGAEPALTARRPRRRQ